ncbi:MULTISPECIES: hypothetical protein [Dyella]|uniref:Uncharacterized protein n=2 Tax=Dyella TaxID=231454 RepID=A0A4R0YTY9_9GAMM|nr:MULTISPECIES: hypothetical protein [Dyella]TBR40518.1 hypothetical protein EYV96_10300 [Dyella terrae]TCI11901.1 hypothetical protein EZM97_00570 [Dyella soli]
MRTLLFVVYYALALMGCSSPRTVTELHSDIDGKVFHGRVVARDGISKFECLDSATGKCRFFVHAGDCSTAAKGATPCTPPPVDPVEVASGQMREVANLPRNIRICLAVDSTGRC